MSSENLGHKPSVRVLETESFFSLFFTFFSVLLLVLFYHFIFTFGEERISCLLVRKIENKNPLFLEILTFTRFRGLVLLGSLLLRVIINQSSFIFNSTGESNKIE
jgi:hypothetical protein